ncbi:retrovirus-related pol polyprotein from transposon TNT 1-94 [Tanacetum coccineum]
MEVRWCGCDDGGSHGGVEDEARGPVDRIDRVAGRVSELGRKTRRKSFPAAVGRSGGGCRILREKREFIQNGDFYYEVEDSETKLMKETPYELLEDDQKKKLGKNNKAKMTLYNALPRKEYERVFMCKTAKEVWHTLIITHQGNSQVKNFKIDLLTQEYENFSISTDETIDRGFTRLNAIVSSLKSLEPDYSRKNHVRKFLRALPLKWRAKVTAIKEAKDLATLPLNELIGNLKVKLLALKGKVTREQTSNDSDSQDGSDEDIDDEEEAEAFKLMARNFHKFFRKGGESLKQKGACYNCGIEGHFASECRKTKENKAFVGGAWSDSEDGDEHQNDATCLMAIESQEEVSKPSSSNYDLNIIDLNKENEELLRHRYAVSSLMDTAYRMSEQ